MNILRCKDLEKKILDNLTERVNNLKRQGVSPSLVMISVGEDPASRTYVMKKEKVAKQLGIAATQINLPVNTTEEELLQIIEKNTHASPTIVQLPLPSHINTDRVIQAIDPLTDVDGFTPINIGNMLVGQPCFIPATPKGILAILDYFKIRTEGKNIAVVGRSNIVGKPLANLLSSKRFNATVTLCHSYTKDLSAILRQMDIVVVATGRPSTVKVSDLKNTAVVIDVGVNRVADTSERGWHLTGDFDKTSAEATDISYTPVPGGVGLLTVAMLMENTVEAFEKRIALKESL